MHDDLMYEAYVNVGATGEEFAEAIKWVIDGGLHETAATHLNRMPPEHHYWEAIVDEIGDATLLMIGVDI
jgi:hypothetical protein